MVGVVICVVNASFTHIANALPILHHIGADHVQHVNTSRVHNANVHAHVVTTYQTHWANAATHTTHHTISRRRSHNNHQTPHTQLNNTRDTVCTTHAHNTHCAHDWFTTAWTRITINCSTRAARNYTTHNVYAYIDICYRSHAHTPKHRQHAYHNTT